MSEKTPAAEDHEASNLAKNCRGCRGQIGGGGWRVTELQFADYISTLEQQLSEQGEVVEQASLMLETVSPEYPIAMTNSPLIQFAAAIVKKTEDLEQQLSEVREERDEWKTTADKWMKAGEILRRERDALRARLHHDCAGCPGCSSNDCPDAIDALRSELSDLTRQRDELRHFKDGVLLKAEDDGDE